MKRRSQYLLGRRVIRQRLQERGEVSVIAVQCLPNTDPWIMYLESDRRGKKGPSVLYRINVKLKTNKE